MNIIQSVNKIQGGMMVVPLLIAALLNTFFPQALKIGSFTTAAFSSAGIATTIGIQLFCIGASLRLKEAPEVIRRGSILLISKYLAGALLGVVIAHFFGPTGIIGISVLAIISSVTGANGSLYLALMGEYGEPIDQAALGIMNIHDGPFLALLTLGATGLANIPLLSLFAAVGPLLLGIILGNLDEDFRKMFMPGIGMLIPFVGFSLGASINLQNIVSAGISGIILGLMVFVIGGGCAFLADRYIAKRPGYAGAAIASAAGNTIATPVAVAMVDPSYASYVSAATTQIAAAVVLTAIIVPPTVGWVAKKYGCPKYDVVE